MPAKKDEQDRKDRVVQTRVNQELGERLKAEAARRRLPVSSLIRNVLEDALELVGNVVDNVDTIAQDAIGLGRQAGADARSLARRASHRGRRPHAGESDPQETEAQLEQASADFSDVYAWQSLTLNKGQSCAAGGESIGKGEAAYMGLSDEPGPRRFICGRCHDTL